MKQSAEPPTQPALVHLQHLLHAAPTEPAANAAALAAARAAAAPAAPLELELLAAEVRWLERQQDPHGEAFAAALAQARRSWLRLRVQGLATGAADVVTLLDLAEAKAAAAIGGEHELEQRCAAAIVRGLPLHQDRAAIEQEVGERFAVLSTAIDDLGLPHQVRLLAETAAVVEALAASTGSATCRRFARRLQRAADDRELARRLEHHLGARGVTVLETTNFVLLLVVLATLLVEATMTLSPGQANVLHWIDALACSFFIADFVFELLLHPARGSWFCRNALTDLLPAIPSVLFLFPVPVPGGADNVMLLRLLRLLRVTWAARYVQFLRPLLRSARLLLFLVRGLDGLTARFAQLLNREFVFVPAVGEVRRPLAEADQRDVLFTTLRREHELLALLSAGERAPELTRRARALEAACARLQPEAVRRSTTGAVARDIPVDEAIQFLWALRPQDLGRWLRPEDVLALDRVVRVLSAVPVRWLPFIRRVAVAPLPATAEERIVACARRVAEWVENWYGRMLFFADLHGIVTGPQILDRVASAMVRASQRPAVRLLLFGGLFVLFDQFIRSPTISAILGKIVGLPLLVLGGVCLVFLLLGNWLKRLAGQASEAFRLTSEAHFISQLELVKPRYEREDLDFLCGRVFGREATPAVRRMLTAQLRNSRTGVPVADDGVSEAVRHEANRVVLLYLHFLDGAPLHASDVKTTEQLLANQALANLRQHFLRHDARERRRLRRLKLDAGSILSGPYLWFSFITESIAVEAAKRIAGYNRYCVPLAERAAASAQALDDMRDWLQRRRDPRGGRAKRDEDRGGIARAYPATEFTALDFLGGDPERDRHVAAVFGDDVLAALRIDRRTMIREIFGMRPVHGLPRQARSFNPLRFYQRRLSKGRVLLLPLLLVWRFVRSFGWVVGRVRQIVREVLDPELAMQRRELGEAPFVVALRKIHRMKAPGLIEAMRMRLALDPVYAGAPSGWSAAEPFAEVPEVERDLRFLHLREHEAASLREQAAAVRAQVAALHAAVATSPASVAGHAAIDAEVRAAGELAVTCAWIADQHDVRTLHGAARWQDEVWQPLIAARARPTCGQRARLWWAGLFGLPEVERWLERYGRGSSRAAAAALRAAWLGDIGGTRELLSAWLELPDGQTPATAATGLLRRAFQHGPAVRRDLMALRAIQSLAVLDIRNYRDLVFQLGDYGADGEARELGAALP